MFIGLSSATMTAFPLRLIATGAAALSNFSGFVAENDVKFGVDKVLIMLFPWP